jgi:hypothetical protein
MTKNQPMQPITEKELKDAINSINRRKSADYYNITIDHFLYSEDQIISILLLLINNIFRAGEIPDSLKIGLLSPIYKNKGSKHDATNYRGITVLPVLSKIFESIIKVRIQPNIQNMQNTSQRGFTKGASPRNAALPVEEANRTSADEKNNGYLVLLDAKAAFDKVVHSHLFRRIYQAGIQNKTWSLISNLHQETKSCIKWKSSNSEMFDVKMGVRKGGFLSADLYKLYINPLLDHLQNVSVRHRIGNIKNNNTGCADDVALISQDIYDSQIMVNMAVDFAKSEGYEFQPQKSVVIDIIEKNKKKTNTVKEIHLKMGDKPMPNVDRATHLGIIRTTSMKSNIRANVDENITKPRRSAYILFGTNFHGTNGLDPESLLHIYIKPMFYQSYYMAWNYYYRRRNH